LNVTNTTSTVFQVWINLNLKELRKLIYNEINSKEKKITFLQNLGVLTSTKEAATALV
jgi:hypothetical protein